MSKENFNRRVNQLDAATIMLVEKQMQILDRIHELLEKKFHGNQKALAAELRVSEAQVSKIINGLQNFTLKSIVSLESAFGEPIIGVTCEPSHVQAGVYSIVQSGHPEPLVMDEQGNYSPENSFSNQA